MSDVTYVKYCPLCQGENPCQQAFCQHCQDGDLTIVHEELRHSALEELPDEDFEATEQATMRIELPALEVEEDARGALLVAEQDPATWQVTSEQEKAAGRHAPWGTLSPGALLCGEYRVERTLYPHETHRAGLFLCQGPVGRVIVKVYATEYPPHAELWQRLTLLRHQNIIRTFRTIEADGFFYEIQEFCTGGTLEDRVPKPGSGFPPLSVEWLTQTFLPQITAALEYLHRQEIIHRDIKPANIYVREEDGKETLVLADFDIASVLEHQRTSRDTLRAAGTWLYTAPEAFPRFFDNQAGNRGARVTRSSDYYSLGITIIELLMGTTSLHLCQLPDLFDFYLQGGRVEIPAHITGKLALLLRGLLIRNRRMRWSAPEVARWLAGQSTEGDLQRVRDDEFYEIARASRPYTLNERMCVDLPGLAEAMLHEPVTATEDIYSADVLLNWIGTLDPQVARNIRRERDRGGVTPELVLYSAIMYCDPTRPFIFPDGVEVYTPEEWIGHAIRQIRELQANPKAFCTPTLLQHLEAWLRCKEHPEPALAAAVAGIQHSPAGIQLEELAYAFQPARPYPVMRGITAHTPTELVQRTYGPAEGWRGKTLPPCYESSFARWQDGALCAWLRQRGLAALATQCEQIREQLTTESYAAFEKILRLLDQDLPPVQVTLDMTEVAGVCNVTYGRQRTYALRYRTHGPGVPFGALTLEDAPTGLRLHDHVVNTRSGEVHLTIDSRQDIRAGHVFWAALRWESGIAQLTKPPEEFSYRVVYPIGFAIQRVLLSAGIGAALIGVPRIILTIMGMGRPVSLDDLAIDNVWGGVREGGLPLVLFIIGLFILAACVYFGLRIWFRAYRRSEI